MGCGESSNKDPFADCEGGKPEPIFNGEFATVSEQHFEIKNMEAIEKVDFENGLHLELVQQGCDKITQLFQFEVPGQFEQNHNWMQLAAEQFIYLSKVSDKHASLAMWSQAIQEFGPQLKLGEKMALGPGFNIKIDKVHSTDNTTLLVELSQ